ncbi:hypothetical protein APHWI1_0896 [Anaplasma phagocytophilum str. ApWI1]|nr:hypothetical protein APHWEB_0620 [Anaplasma phagocytophilum str. Webster]KJV68353.1 hypothetical protein EPHNCH_0104 [Anaplasma phagocytophilum str. NCH-1]KJV82790.1 hypothetical protein APHHGE2_0128 [Anaplasma phagocytophilum str. HGE2]KJV84526.1 hypothetical protein APHWI1_0896 [Anaplasma phagocytophilum str. ApWI1]KJV86432.1 hypothetical protein APHNYW_1441 [Anaplasma phagocytophilum str. ApNYW]KJV99640.1 hypothetical protein OTSANNIE_0073 [Anaplasma phagocytophilum str. Annie]KJZ99962.
MFHEIRDFVAKYVVLQQHMYRPVCSKNQHHLEKSISFINL